jgi:hypothetical protein
MMVIFYFKKNFYRIEMPYFSEEFDLLKKNEPRGESSRNFLIGFEGPLSILITNGLH